MPWDGQRLSGVPTKASGAMQQASGHPTIESRPGLSGQRWHAVRTSTRLKLGATAIIAVPVTVLLVMAAGEIAGGDETGLQHIPEAALLALFAWAGWRRPRVAGWLLLATGVAVFVVFFALVLTNGDPSFRGWAILIWVGVSLLVFAPPAIAGALLLRAAQLERGSDG